MSPQDLWACLFLRTKVRRYCYSAS